VAVASCLRSSRSRRRGADAAWGDGDEEEEEDDDDNDESGGECGFKDTIDARKSAAAIPILNMHRATAGVRHNDDENDNDDEDDA